MFFVVLKRDLFYLFPDNSSLSNVCKPLVQSQHLALEVISVDAFSLFKRLNNVLEHFVLAFQHCFIVEHSWEERLQQRKYNFFNWESFFYLSSCFCKPVHNTAAIKLKYEYYVKKKKNRISTLWNWDWSQICVCGQWIEYF